MMTDNHDVREKGRRRRMFLALDLPPEAKSEVDRVRVAIEPQQLFRGRWTKTENLHVTLKFLGEIDESLVTGICASLRRVAFPPLSVYLDCLGVFDSHKRIRIIWIHLAGDAVVRLQRLIDETLADRFPVEQRFMSHVTIARVKSVTDAGMLKRALDSIPVHRDSFTIDRFYLKESLLSSAGAKYGAIETYSATGGIATAAVNSNC